MPVDDKATRACKLNPALLFEQACMIYIISLYTLKERELFSRSRSCHTSSPHFSCRVRSISKIFHEI